MQKFVSYWIQSAIALKRAKKICKLVSIDAVDSDTVETLSNRSATNEILPLMDANSQSIPLLAY